MLKISCSIGSIDSAAGAGAAADGAGALGCGGAAAGEDFCTDAGGFNTGASRIPASAQARDISVPTSKLGARAVSSCSTSSGTAATASRNTVMMSGVRSSVLLMMRLRSVSIAHANSPISFAPTMRPLPLSVWKERRTLTSESVSCGFSSHIGNSCCRRAISSFASSMNSSRNSGSDLSGGNSRTAGKMPVARGDIGALGVIGLIAAACSAWVLVRTSVRSPSVEVGSVELSRDGSIASVCVYSGPPGSDTGLSDSADDCSASTWRHMSALSSMYQGSLRPACSVSM